MSRLPTQKPGETPDLQSPRLETPGAEPLDRGNPKTVEEIASDSIRGVDEPMEVEHPESPAMLVFGTYPLLLIAVILIGLGLFWWWKGT